MINFRGGKSIIKKSLFSYMSSRGFFWTLSVLWMMPSFIYLFVWIAAVGNGTIGGFNRDDFIFYYICIISINQLTYPTSNWLVGDNIRNGSFSTWLTHPLPIIYRGVAPDIAVKMICLPFIVIIVAVLMIILTPEISISLNDFGVFIISLMLSQVLRFTLAYVLSLLAIWNQRSDSLLTLNDTLVFFFSGQVAPIMLLPSMLKDIAYALPFRYMIGFPAEVLSGKLENQEIILGIAIQLGWVVFAIIIHEIVWKRALKHYSAVGG